MSKIIYEKTFDGSEIEDIDPTDFLWNDEIQTDIFGDAHGTFTVIVRYEPDDDFDPSE